jgi:hypothetical protein
MVALFALVRPQRKVYYSASRKGPAISSKLSKSLRLIAVTPRFMMQCQSTLTSIRVHVILMGASELQREQNKVTAKLELAPKLA